MPVTTCVDGEPLEIEQLGQQHGQLVGGAVGDRSRCASGGQAAARLVLEPMPSPGAREARRPGRRRTRPITVWVLPTSMASSIRSAPSGATRSRPMSRTGAEWVRAPTEIEVGAGGRVARPRSSRVTPPETSIRVDRPARPPSRRAHGRPPARASCCRAARRSAPASTRLVDLLEAVALDLDRSGPASGAGPGPRPRRWRAPARWLSLTRMASDRRPGGWRRRRPAPPPSPAPAGPAWSCGCRGPGWPGWRRPPRRRSGGSGWRRPTGGPGS